MPVFLPGESRGQRSLVGYSPGAHKEPDVTEMTGHTTLIFIGVFLVIAKNSPQALQLVDG